jgi:hypothetical protein
VVGFFVLLVAAGFVMWRLRLMPPPARADVGRRRRAGGRLVSAAGMSALGFIVAAIAGSGVAGYAFFVFMSFFSFPPVAAAIACARTGWRLSRNVPASRVTAAVSGGALTLCAAFWTWFWWSFEVGHNFVVGSRSRIEVEACVIAAIGLLAAVGAALIAVPAAADSETARSVPAPPLPAARRIERWEIASALIAAGLVATVVAGLSTAGSARTEAVSASATSEENAALCAVVLSAATHDLSSVDYGSPAPPRIAGAKTVGAVVVSRGAAAWSDAPGRSALPGNSDADLIVVERVNARHPIDLERPARQAIMAAALTPSARPNITAVNDEVDSLTLAYEGQGVHGAISYARCYGESLAVVVQEVRADRTGVCRDYVPACAEMWADAAGPMTIIDDAFQTDGAHFERPTFSLEGDTLVLTASVDEDASPFMASMDVDTAMKDWHDVRLVCDGEPCFDHAMMGVQEKAVGVYRLGNVTATVTLTALGTDRSHFAVRITRPVTR